MRVLKITVQILIYGPLACICAFVALSYWKSRDLELKGPRSEKGLQAFILVDDRGLGWGADFYCDVEIRDQSGKVVAKWDDDGGQQSDRGVDNLVESMRWISERTITFKTHYGNDLTSVSIP